MHFLLKLFSCNLLIQSYTTLVMYMKEMNAQLQKKILFNLVSTRSLFYIAVSQKDHWNCVLQM